MRRRTILVALVAFAAALAALAGVRLHLPSTREIGFASPDGDLSCSVKTSCEGSEVEMLRLSGPTNAHAGTLGGSTYSYRLCCDGEVGNACSGHFDTMLTLYAEDNAHVAVDGSYGTQVCLSASDTQAQCTYGDTCGDAYTCVATVSGDNNAHIADCDGVDDYTTKVCCTACDWSVPAGDPDFDWLQNDAEDKNGDGVLDYDPDRLLTETDACLLDTDGDGCADYEELGASETLGGLRHPVDEWDFFDVPLPVGDPGTGTKDKQIDGNDVLGVLSKFGASPGDPNPSAPKYDEAYDRSTPSPNSWNTGAPDGVQDGNDVIWNLWQFGHSCFAPP